MRNNYLLSENAVVDVDNSFSFRGISFKIPEDNEQYRVINKYDESEDYDNESNMDNILVVLGKDFKFYFYDQNGDEVKNVKMLKY